MELFPAAKYLFDIGGMDTYAKRALGDDPTMMIKMLIHPVNSLLYFIKGTKRQGLLSIKWTLNPISARSSEACIPEIPAPSTATAPIFLSGTAADRAWGLSSGRDTG